MFKSNFILLGFIIAFQCCHEKEIGMEMKPLGIINGHTIYEKDIDSLIYNQVYEIKKQALNTLIERAVIQTEAKRFSLSVNELLENEVKNKYPRPTSEDYLQYINRKNIPQKDIDSLKIISYINSRKMEYRKDIYVDSLIEQSDVSIYLKPKYFKELDIGKIDYFDLTPASDIVVYIISDYDCPACQSIEPKLMKIIQKYNNKVNFRFVFHSDYISKKALAASAASKQDGFQAMHDFLFVNRNKISNDSGIISIAQNLQLDLTQFKEDYYNPNTLKTLLNTKKQLIEKGVYSTPTIILNSKVLDDEFAVFVLENMIKYELDKK